MPATPIKFSGRSVASRRGAPVLGQHTAEVLEEHGFSSAEIGRLAGDGVVRQHGVPVAG